MIGSKQGVIGLTFSLLIGSPFYAYAQNSIIEEEPNRIEVVPKIIERQAIIQPGITAHDLTPVRRSNYSKRLGDMLEQITFAHDRGWLTDAQFADLRNWQASVAMEELLLRQKGGGIIARDDVDQLEKHLNGLAYTINREVDAGSRLSSSTASPL